MITKWMPIGQTGSPSRTQGRAGINQTCEFRHARQPPAFLAKPGRAPSSSTIDESLIPPQSVGALKELRGSIPHQSRLPVAVGVHIVPVHKRRDKPLLSGNYTAPSWRHHARVTNILFNPIYILLEHQNQLFEVFVGDNLVLEFTLGVAFGRERLPDHSSEYDEREQHEANPLE